MLLPATENEVFALFIPASRVIMENLVSEGRIMREVSGDAGNTGQTLAARVAGNRPRPFTVSIALDAGSDLASSFCDCQSPAPCVHIGAVWISELRRKSAGRSGLEFSQSIAERFALDSQSTALPSVPPQPVTAPAGPYQSPPLILLSADNPLDLPTPEPEPIAAIPGLNRPTADLAEITSSLGRIFGLPVETTALPAAGDSSRTAERWRLGFQLDSINLPQATAGGLPATMRRFSAVKPCLVFIRQDGGDGRLRDFEPSLLSEEPDPTDRTWLDMLQSQGGQIDLDRMLMLAELTGMPALPRIRNGSSGELTLQAADSLEICFLPRALPWGSREIEYKATLRTAIGGELFLIRSFECGLRRIFLVCEGALIAWLPTEHRLAAVLDLLAGRRWLLEPSIIHQLQAGLAKNPVPQLTVTFSGESITRRLCRGLAVLSLETGADGMWTNGKRATYMRVEIDWDFAEAEPEEDPEPDWTRIVGIDPETKSATLWIRDLHWEVEVIQWLRRELARLLTPDDSTSQADLIFAPPRRVDGKYHALPDATGLIGQVRAVEEQRAFSLNIELNAFLRDWGASLMDAGFALRLRRDSAPSTRGSVNIQVDNGLDWLDIEAQINTFSRGKGTPGARKRAARQARNKALSPERRVELAAVQDLLDHRIVRSNQGLILLSPDDAAKLQRLIGHGLQPGQPHRIAHGDIATLAGLHGPETAHIREIAVARNLVDKLASLDQQTMEDPEPGFAATLRGYQRRGFSWLVHMHESGLGACLADDMGLGKTVQALAFLQKIAARYGAEFRCLLVAPVSTLPNWQSETARFTPDLHSYLHHGDGRRNADNGDFGQAIARAEITLVSFATLRNDLALFASRDWHVLLVDEAQNIKNPESATFAAIRTLKARQRISLTGTPVENGVRDLWAQMDFINPGMLGSLKRFGSRYAASIEERQDGQALQSLRRIVAPFVLRRRKEDVARDLPPKEEIVLYCDLAPAQRKIYEDIKEAYRLKIDESVKKNGASRSAMTILEALLRLRQACLFPSLINPAWADCGSAKADLLADIMTELAAEDHKALIFSQFTEVLDRIGGNLKNSDLDFVRLDGQTANRAAPIARFQDDPACRLFLISLKAGGVGINLTAADYVILFDPWWNPAVENQAIDRAHRIGRDRPVIVYRLIARDTVEEKMLTLQQRKRELALSLTDSDESLAGSLSPGELLELLG